MATFTLKRGDTAPAIEISLSKVGTEPREFWDGSLDKPDGVNQREIKEVRFIMLAKDNTIVGSTSVDRYTGVGSFRTESSKTILAYSWKEGDTITAGNYKAEFEVIYENATGGYGKKRTFPSTTGDTLTIIIEEDTND